jgi:cytochrome c-type biogenesis protein CcmH
MTRLAAAILLTLLLLASGAHAAAPRAELTDIEDEVMCPVCGTALNLSESPQAEREREFIRRQIAAGKTKGQIKEALVAQYGEKVLAEPPKHGFDLAAWILPIVALLLAVLAAGFGLRGWRRRRSAGRSGPPTEEESERLRADLARYDL